MRYCSIILLFTFSFLLPISLTAQIKEIKKADECFYNFNYKKAIKLYKQIEEKGDALYYVTHRIGDCYRHLGETEESVNWYLKAKDYPDVDFSTFLILSQELKKLKRYEEANQFLKQYNELAEIDNSGTLLSKSKLNLLKRDSSNFEIFNLPINTASSEIAPVIYDNKLVFCSNKGEITALKRSDIRDGSSFYKLYSSKINDHLVLTEPKLFSKKLLSKYNDGPIAFNSDNDIAFLTRNMDNKNKRSSYLNVFVVYKDKGKWNRKMMPIPLHQTNFSLMHAFLTKDETRFYFVSDMDGGYGGLDIYFSYYKNGFLSPPVNLGPNVNSSGNEMFPFVSEDNILYYSSDKPGSLGGMDVFFALPKGETFSTSFNMGYPINTSYDDFGLIYYENNKQGYFVSNRDGGKGKDDIYAFEQKVNYNYAHYEGRVLSSQESAIVSNAIVNIYQNSELITSTTTDNKGEFSFYADSEENLFIEIKKRFFETFKSKLENIAHSEKNGYSVQVVLKAY